MIPPVSQEYYVSLTNRLFLKLDVILITEFAPALIAVLCNQSSAESTSHSQASVSDSLSALVPDLSGFEMGRRSDLGWSCGDGLEYSGVA